MLTEMHWKNADYLSSPDADEIIIITALLLYKAEDKD